MYSCIHVCIYIGEHTVYCKSQAFQGIATVELHLLYGVASISTLLEITGLFCRIWSLL